MQQTGFIYSSKCVLILTFWIFFFCIPHNAIAQEGYEIRKVRFSGNKSFGKSELLNNMNIYEVNIVQRMTKRKEPYFYNSEFIQNDLEKLIRFYQSEGYIYVQAHVDTVNVNVQKRKLDIIFRIKEGIPIVVDSISIGVTDNDSIINTRRLQRLTRRLSLQANKPFRDASVSEDILAINKLFQNRGYAYASTSYSLNIDTGTNTSQVHYQTKVNRRATFGATTITGHKFTNDRLLRRQLTYSQGDRYSAEKLDKLRENLYGLQLFRIISVVPQKDESRPLVPIPINITLEEMPRLSTEFGIGYGTEDKLRTYIDLTYKGIFNDASRVNFYFKHSALEPYHISLKLIQPQFLDKRTSIMINPYYRRQVEPGYDTQTLGLSVPLSRKFNNKLNMALNYYYEKVAQKVENDDTDALNPENRKYLYNKSGFQYSASYATAYPITSPVRGFSSSLGFKFNGYFFPSDFNYTKLWVDLRKYSQIKKFSFAFRGMIGNMFSADSTQFIPVEDRYYSGGSTSIRGWGRSRLGPKRDSDTPLGGKSIIEMSAEMRHPIIGNLEAAAFIDAGNVWTESSHYPLKNIAYSVGLGLRYKTPIGPIRLDVSRPIFNEKKSLQLFLSIGQAF